MIWAKIDKFLMSAKPHGDFLKIFWDPRKSSVVAEIVLYQDALYRGSSVPVTDAMEAQTYTRLGELTLET